MTMVQPGIPGAGDTELATEAKQDLIIAQLGLTAGVDFDYIGVVATNSTTDTLTFRLGGAGGTIARTMVITYTSSSASKVSDTFSVLEF